MPFTLSHPAVVIPLAKRGLPLSGLVIGSITPDLPYFLRQSTSDQSGHSLLGIFTYCVPVGLLLFAIFHLVLKYPLLSLLPLEHQKQLEKVAGSAKLTLPQLPMVVLALIIGAISHIIWDSFTHANGWMVQHFVFLQITVIQSGTTSVALFKILQHGGSLAGLTLMAYWYYRWFQCAPNTAGADDRAGHRRTNLSLLVAMVIFSVILAGIIALSKNTVTETDISLQAIVRQFILTAIASLALEILAYSVFWHWRERNKDGYTG